MRKFIVLFIVIVAASPLSAQWIFGGGVKYNTNNSFKAFAINGKFGKDISEKFDIDLDVSYYIASKATWAFDLNCHYRLLTIGNTVSINPLAGINFTKIKSNNLYSSLLLGFSTKISADRYTYYIEPKWVMNDNQLSLSVGVLF